MKWSHWLANAIPGTKRRVELKSARLFFPEERSDEFNKELEAHWVASSRAGTNLTGPQSQTERISSRQAEVRLGLACFVEGGSDAYRASRKGSSNVNSDRPD